MTLGERYTYRVAWSGEDEGFVGTVAKFPSLSWAANSIEAALAGVRGLVVGVLENMADAGETPPAVIGDQPRSRAGHARRRSSGFLNLTGAHHVGESFRTGTPRLPDGVDTDTDIAGTELREAVASHSSHLDMARDAVSEASSALDRARASLRRAAARAGG